MKKLLIPAVMMGLSATTAYAAGGAYVGGLIGYGDTGYEVHHAFIPMDVLGTPTTDISHIPSSSVNANGLAGRVFAGYQFNPSLAVEAGYSLFSKTDTTVGSAFKCDISTQAIDATGKLIYPVNNNFNIYAKGGAALVHANQDITGTTSLGLTRISDTTDPIRPLFGAGAGVNLAQNVTLDASWTRIQGNNNIQNIDFYGAGLTYYFG
jgi:OmpA-OmpF porin, OOP family